MKFKKLVIAPHADDEVLGCGGILDDDTYVFYCGLDESKIAEKTEYRIPLDSRKEEVLNVAKFLKFSYEINEENLVNNYDISLLIGQIEKIINKIKPETIFLPFPSYNQDHKTVYDASRIALRPHDNNWMVKKILIYEQPHSFLWEEKKFSAQYFIPIDINKKIDGYLLHKSQVREFRSPKILHSMAKLRGASIGTEYAEAYMIERWVD